MCLSIRCFLKFGRLFGMQIAMVMACAAPGYLGEGIQKLNNGFDKRLRRQCDEEDLTHNLTCANPAEELGQHTVAIWTFGPIVDFRGPWAPNSRGRPTVPEPPPHLRLPRLLPATVCRPFKMKDDERALMSAVAGDFLPYPVAVFGQHHVRGAAAQAKREAVVRDRIDSARDRGGGPSRPGPYTRHAPHASRGGGSGAASSSEPASINRAAVLKAAPRHRRGVVAGMQPPVDESDL